MGLFNFIFNLVAGAATKREYGRDTWNPPPDEEPKAADQSAPPTTPTQAPKQ